MGEPGEERENPPSELWGRWRARRAARARAAEPPPAEPPAPGAAPAGAEPAAPEPSRDEPGPRPSAGWTGREGAGHECLEWCPICRTADIVRAGFGPELQAPLRDIQREGLSILRSAIDLYIQHLEDEPPPRPAGEAPTE